MGSWESIRYIGDYTTQFHPSYIEIIISHYKDPYEATSTMESKRVFFVAQLNDFHIRLDMI